MYFLNYYNRIFYGFIFKIFLGKLWKIIIVVNSFCMFFSSAFKKKIFFVSNLARNPRANATLFYFTETADQQQKSTNPHARCQLKMTIFRFFREFIKFV